MSFIEFIGFIISLVAMVFIFFKRVFEEKKRQKDPASYAERDRLKQEALKKIYGSFHLNDDEIDEEEDEEERERASLYPPVPVRKSLPPAPPKKPMPPIPEKKHVYYGSHEFQAHDSPQKMQESRDRLANPPAYQVNRVARDSKAGRLLQHLSSKQDMLIIKEIFDKPLSMRQPFEDNFPL